MKEKETSKEIVNFGLFEQLKTMLKKNVITEENFKQAMKDHNLKPQQAQGVTS